MTDKHAFDRQLAREIDNLAGPEPRVDVRDIVETATRSSVRPRFGWLTGSLRLATAVAVIAVFAAAAMFGLGIIGERAVVVDPAASPTATAGPTPNADGSTPVAGTWIMAHPPRCSEDLGPLDRPDIAAFERCDGLTIRADDARLTGAGTITREIGADGGAMMETWKVANDGGSWESFRLHDHDRFVFIGRDGYYGLTAVVTLADDGSLGGFVRAGEPLGD